MQTLFARQPLYAPLQPLLAALPQNTRLPSLAELNVLAAQLDVRSGGGKPLRFVLPHGSGLSYEERVWWLGEVETRPDNWHDAFNALVWLSFPRLKSALNHCHHQVLTEQRQQAAHDGSRGPLRDMATQFDECGAIVVASDPALWQAICEHRWKELFCAAREQVVASLRVFIVGHASYDLLRQPHIGLCAKAVFLHVHPDWLMRPLAEQLADVDTRIAQRFHADKLGGYTTPGDFQPLPLLGIPGATADNEYPEYYDNTRQFRPLRIVDCFRLNGM